MQDSERVISDKQVMKYNTNVLVGNWVEERSRYLKHKHKLSSTYQTDFIPKKYTSLSDFVLDRLISAQGTPLGSEINMSDNFTTIYDLSYNHFPKWLGMPITRKLRSKLATYDPKDEYLNNYGNITSYGLVQYKKENWRCDKDDPRMTVTTHNRDTYIAPDPKSYKIKRFTAAVSDLNCSGRTKVSITCNPITPCEDIQKIRRRCVNIKNK